MGCVCMWYMYMHNSVWCIYVYGVFVYMCVCVCVRSENCVHCQARVETHDKTGVEMEALSAVQTALLTVYDMCKSVDRGMTIESVRLIEKSGGSSGTWTRKEED